MANSPIISLQEAMRTARLDETMIADAVLAGREADYLRLAQLNEKITPIFAEIPKYIDLFDVAMVAGDRPRIWLDMVSFIEMNSENRHFRFYKDTRDGRVLLAESNDQEIMVKVITEYVARRLVARERLLETDSPSLQPSASPSFAPTPSLQQPEKPKTNWLLSAVLFVVCFTAIYLLFKSN